MREIKDLSQRPPLRDPILITGFGVQRRGGRSANRAVSHLTRAWSGELVAAIDAEEFVDLTVRRPDIDTGPERWTLDWPETRFFLAKPEGAKQDILLAVGFEPNFRWSAYVDSVAAYAERLGVKTLVSVRSFPGQVPHTRPAPVMINASDIELELQFGVQARRTRYEGPTDVSGVLASRVQNLRWRTADLTILQPEYYPRMPNAQATLSLLKVLDYALGTKTSTRRLLDQAAEQLRVIEDNVSSNRDLRTAIAELERQYDEGAERMDFLTTGVPSQPLTELPSGEDVIEEVERLFREGGKPQ